MSWFLWEIASEEIPALMQEAAAQQLARRFTQYCQEQELPYKELVTHVTPRRLVLYCDGLPATLPQRQEEIKGPKISAPDRALQGFLTAHGIELDQCEQRETAKGPVWVYCKILPQRNLSDCLARAIMEIIHGFDWPKSMAWQSSGQVGGQGGGEDPGSGEDVRPLRWIRPIRRIMALCDGQAIQGGIHPEIPFIGRSFGHPRFDNQGFDVQNWEQYQQELAKRFVTLDRNTRLQKISDQVQRLADTAQVQVDAKDSLLDEVAGLTEWPVALIGAYEEDFLQLPAEILRSSMQHHQRYFPLRDSEGNLTARFITIADLPHAEKYPHIVAGNERVLRARLSDARFFWQQDCARPLPERLQDLERVSYHEKLGNMAEKAKRLEKLTAFLADYIPGVDRNLAAQAGLLAKVDLTTEMVGEFPELQGVMGGHYARQNNLCDELALALTEQYHPQGPDSSCPSAPLSVAVALADRLDHLAVFFGAGIRPTGSSDPFALRRAALGVIRLLVENHLRCPLRALLAQALSYYPDLPQRPDMVAEITDFILARMQQSLRQKNLRHDVMRAVLDVVEIDAPMSLPKNVEGSSSICGFDYDITDLTRRMVAIQAFLAGNSGESLLNAVRRAGNILVIEKNKGAQPDIKPEQLTHPAEKHLYQLLLPYAAFGKEHPLQKAIAQEQYEMALQQIAHWREAVDQFFDQVKVVDEDEAIRNSRLGLLQLLVDNTSLLANFLLIEGGKK